MTITDELRKALRHSLSISDYDRLLAIADRIDAEHERECKEQYACGAEHGIGASIEASMIHDRGFIELPKDADGEYIHVGDRVEHTNGTFTVNDMTFSIDGQWRAWDSENGLAVLLTKCRHYHEPTVEDLLCELLDKVDDDRAGQAEIIAEYAKKLQLRGDAE